MSSVIEAHGCYVEQKLQFHPLALTITGGFIIIGGGRRVGKQRLIDVYTMNSMTEWLDDKMAMEAEYSASAEGRYKQDVLPGIVKKLKG